MNDDEKFLEDINSDNYSIETTKERRNKTICPRTVADAVYIDGEETLTDRLNNISLLINNLEDYLNPLEILDLRINGENENKIYALGNKFFSLTLEWEYNKEIGKQCINGEEIDKSLTSYTLPEIIYPQEQTTMNFKLRAKDKRINKYAEKDISISFQNYIYTTASVNSNYPAYVFNTNESRKNKQFIESLGNEYMVAAYEGYIWVALPLRFLDKDEYGNYMDVTFTVNGFDGGFEGGVKDSNFIIELKNETGFSEEYVFYRSCQPRLGVTTFRIS